jgi:hypothetical protein
MFFTKEDPNAAFSVKTIPISPLDIIMLRLPDSFADL